MSKSARSVSCTEAERAALERCAFSRTVPTALAVRAQIVLGCLDGKQVTEIAQAFRTRPNTVIKWRDRFVRQRLAGLKDALRPGPRRVYDEGFRDRVLGLLDSPPPVGVEAWDGPSLASTLQASAPAVWRVLRQAGRSLRRQRFWSVPTALPFPPKTVELVGLYLSGSARALLALVADTPPAPNGVYATGEVWTDHGSVARALHRAARAGGGLSLAGALRACLNQTAPPVSDHKRREDFLGFVERVLNRRSTGPPLRLLLDGDSPSGQAEAWLAPYAGRLLLESISPSARWVESVELWLRLLLGDTPPGGPPTALSEALRAFHAACGPTIRPFRWLTHPR